MPCSYEERRTALEGIEGLELTPIERTADGAQHWLHEEEGVIAKELAAPYLPGERKGMVKIKRVRTIDAVVMGWRPGKLEGTVGAIILGLYEPDGRLREVGHSSGFTAKRKKELVARARALRDRRARQRRPVALDAGPRPGVGRAAARARRRGDVRPRLRRAHPPRHEGPALARRQAARRVPRRSARAVRAAAVAAACERLTHSSRSGNAWGDSLVRRPSPQHDDALACAASASQVQARRGGRQTVVVDPIAGPAACRGGVLDESGGERARRRAATPVPTRAGRPADRRDRQSPCCATARSRSAHGRLSAAMAAAHGPLRELVARFAT